MRNSVRKADLFELNDRRKSFLIKMDKKGLFFAKNVLLIQKEGCVIGAMVQ